MRSFFSIFIVFLFFTVNGCSAFRPARPPFALPEVEKTSHSGEAQRKEAALELETTAGDDEDPSAILRQMEEKNTQFNEKLANIIAQSESKVASVRKLPKMTENGRVESLSVDFFDADLIDVVRLFMTVLEEDWTLHPNVGGKVTLHLEDDFARDQIFDLLQGILSINGAAMVNNGHVWEILPLSEVPHVIGGNGIILPDADLLPVRGQVVQGFKLKFAAASEIINILKPYLSKGAMLYANDPQGVLLVCDYPHSLARVGKLIDLFDVSLFADLKIRVFSLKYVIATDLAEELEALARTTGIMNQKGLSSVSFVALDRLNMLCVMAKEDSVLDFVGAWVDELDRDLPEVVKEEQAENIYVYFVQNGDAEEIVKSLEGVFGSKVKTNKPAQATEQEQAPLGKQIMEARKGEKNLEDVAVDFKESISPENPSVEKSSSIHDQYKQISGELSGPVTFVVDSITNAILVRCVGSDYNKIESIIKKLDVYPKQALIEVVIAEVSLDDSTKLGVEWSYLFNLEDEATGTLSNDSGLGVVTEGESAIASGLGFVVSGARFKGALKAFAGNNNVQILSSPHILASNHQEASIDIGEEVPIVTAEFSTTDVAGSATTTDKTIQYKNVGIILKVTPHINEAGLVRMEISQEISETSNKSIEGVNSPVFSTRTASTKVAINDGETVIIGGLMKQQRAIANSGLPGVNKTPILKYLFGYEGEEYRSTELLLFITPHVVKSREDNTLLSKNFIKRLDELKQKLR